MEQLANMPESVALWTLLAAQALILAMSVLIWLRGVQLRRRGKELERSHRQLEYVARYDALTDLPNRVLLADRLLQGMARARREQKVLAVAYIDLDGFKSINDAHGHEIGDEFLVAIANHLRLALRETDTVARIGGDEFVAVLSGLHAPNMHMHQLERILTAVARPVDLRGQTFQVTASIGVTFYPVAGHEVDPDQLIRQADQAMYQAKLSGKSRYCLFDREMDQDMRGLHEGRERLRQALDAGRFELYYQPKVNLRSGALSGAEALIRLHTDDGLEMPGTFLPLIQNDALAVELGKWVIRTALRQLQTWQKQGLDTDISVNVDAYHLQRPDFVERLREMLEEFPEVSPSQLQLEVLETGALNDIHKVADVMRAASALGVSFAIDDFGTGYSSLTYLKHLPAAELKIDRSFVRDALEDPDDLAILEGVVGLASAFQRGVIAEGVESAEHAELLLQLGCDRVQGYAIARPMPAQQLPDWYCNWRPDPAWSLQPVISRHRLPLLFARVEHQSLYKAVLKALDGNGSWPDASTCRFQPWLNDARKGLNAKRSDLKVMAQLHGEFHSLLLELADLQQRHGLAAARQRFGELEHVCKALLAALCRELGLPAAGPEESGDAQLPLGQWQVEEGTEYVLF